MAERDVDVVVSEQEVDALVAVFNGNARDALRAVMHDLAMLVDHHNATASRGFGRRQRGVSVWWGRGAESGPSRG